MSKSNKVHPAPMDPWKLDMMGEWSGADGSKYHLRIILESNELGEALWAGTPEDKPYWYSGWKPHLSDEYCIKLMSASPGDRGSPNQREAAGNKGYNTPNELIRSGHRSRPNLQGDEIPVGGIIQWYVSKESTPEMLAQISRIIAQSGGGTGVGTTSERAFEFVCGVYSPSTGRLVVGGTHMSNSGKGVIGLDLYDLNLSKDNMEVSGFSQGNDASHGGADLWKSTISGQVPTMAKHIEGVDFTDLRSRDNEELRAFAKAAAAIAKIRDDEARTRVKTNHLLMFKAITSVGPSNNTEEGLRLFQVLKEIADKQAKRLGRLIELCMQKYKTVSERYKYVDNVIDQTEYKQQPAPSIAGDETTSKLRALLAIAKFKEPPFRKLITSLIKDVNRAGSNKKQHEEYTMKKFCSEYNLNESLFPFEMGTSVTLPGRDAFVIGTFGPPKSFDRALTKLNVGKELEDMNRVTLVVEDPYIMGLIYSALQAKYNVVGVKNKFKQEGGWEQPPDLHLILDLEDGWLVEVQLLFQDILEIKKEMHRYYNIERAASPLEILGPLYKIDVGEKSVF